MNSYNKTEWVNGSTPAISADNLNKIEQGIYDNRLYKQDWFVNSVVYDVASVKLNSTDEVMFNGKFRFTPDSQAPENQYDLINRQMLETFAYSKSYINTALGTKANASAVYTKTEIDDKKQNKFATVDPTSGDIELFRSPIDNKKIYLVDFRAKKSGAQENDFDIMNRAMVSDLITGQMDELIFYHISGFNANKSQILKNDHGYLKWVDEV